MKTIELRDIIGSPRMRREMVVGIIEGKVFLYPTDTLYGLGCDAMNHAAVKRIRIIKSSNHPFSVIAPSKGWILENLVVRHERYLDRLPGPYTLIFRARKSIVCRQVSGRTLGVRIPDHPLTEVIQESGQPFVSTSANMSGEIPVWSTAGVPSGIERNVDVAIHDDILRGPASTVIDLTGRSPKVLRKP
jgi:tRNA threonylcarbamoyl adenosine modification protein (Sua5/YciO/YrdC/YwlC family)